jgi:Tfp pilus assembly protein PilE
MTHSQTTNRNFSVPQAESSSMTWPWTALDVAWLQFLKSHQATPDPLHDLLALMVSHQMGRGHACLDLNALWQHPEQLLDWTDAQTKRLLDQAGLTKPSHAPPDLFVPAVNPWAVAAQTMPWAMGAHSPIVMSFQEDGQAQRVYLRRAWQAEQSIQSSIQMRLAQNFEVPQNAADKLNKLFGAQSEDTDWQRIACGKALRAGLTLITGGPGTGKTTTMVSAVRAALTTCTQVLVCAPSNAAADLLTERLAASGVKVLRIGNPARISEEILPYTMDHLIGSHGDAKEIKRLRKLAYELKRMAWSYKKYYDRSEREQKQAMLKEARSILQQIANMEQYVLDQARGKTQAFVATLVGASHHFLKDKKFEWVFIDEAGQALEPASWIPVLKANRLVMAGDHCQLPPTVKSKEAAKQGLEQTLMEKFLARSTEESRAMLEVQYRSHRDIMEFSSAYFYQNKLQPWEGVASHRLWNESSEANSPLVFLDTAGTGFEERFHPESAGLSNPGEATLLIRHFSAWMETNEAFLKQRLQIAVISPYREQVELLKKETAVLEKQYGNKVKFRCGTVDGFQGQEADLVYISLVRSNDRREIGFLRDIRRMNVAITRARKRLVVIGDSATLAGFGFYDELLDYLQKKAQYQSAWEFPE